MKQNLVGIISDTHDHKENIKKAVVKFNEAGCSLVVHAGDFIAPFTVREFEKLNCPFIGVFGNNDGEIKGLSEQYSKIGIIYKGPHEFEYYGKRFVVMHKHKKVKKYLKRDDIDVIVYGHLHEIDIRQGKPMVINPGESCSWLADRATIVLLDLSSMNVEIVEL
ncbi:metallophosphoesterase [Candidatus Latescibacterota bacterium]